MNKDNIVPDRSKSGYLEIEDIDLASAQALFKETLNKIFNEDKLAINYLHDLVCLTIGIERLSVKMCRPVQTVKRMLSDTGNPTFKNLTAILTLIRKELNVQVEVTVVPPWKAQENVISSQPGAEQS